jgi:hypothetical protein
MQRFIICTIHRRMKWTGHVARMREMKVAYGVLVGKPEGKRPFGRSRKKWEGNMTLGL